MIRVDEDALALHLEVALFGAAPSLLGNLAADDCRQRHAATAAIARQLAERLRCFEWRWEEAGTYARSQPALFSDDLGPIGQ